MNLKDKIRVIDNFPKDGISFKADGEGLRESVNLIANHLKDKNIDIVVGPEARGFIFGVPVAYALGAGFVPVRKPGKLPGETLSIAYDLEYGTDNLELDKFAIKKGQRVAIVDDLLATGGTIEAVTKLVELAGGEVVSLNFVIELTDLKGRDKLKGYDVMSLTKYDA